MNEGGGERPAGGIAGPNNNPRPPAPSETEPHRIRNGIAHAGSTISPTVRCASLAKRPKPAGRTPAAQKAPNPETALRQQIKAATEELVKEALDAAAGSKAPNAEVCAGSKEQADEPGKKVGREDRQADRDFLRGRARLWSVPGRAGRSLSQESPGSWRVHCPNGSSFAVCQNTGPHWASHGQCGPASPFASRRGREWRCGNGRKGFREARRLEGRRPPLLTKGMGGRWRDHLHRAQARNKSKEQNGKTRLRPTSSTYFR